MFDLPILIDKPDILQMTAQRRADARQVLLAQLLLFFEFFFREADCLGFLVQLIDAFDALVVNHPSIPPVLTIL